MKQQWLKTSELEEIQRKMLRGIIKHVYENVPLCHQMFKDASVRPEDFGKVRIYKKRLFRNLHLNIGNKIIDKINRM